MPKTMRAAAYDRYGDADVVGVRETADEPPGRGEVRLDVRAAALNPKDVMVRKGRYRWLSGGRFPKRPGLDVAGVVVDVGSGVDASLVGARVAGMLDGFRAATGTLAERVNVPASQITRIEESLSFGAAAALPLAGCTALQALRDAGRLRAGERVCILGASGGVGTLAIGLARHLGAHVTAVGSARSVDLLASLGADVVLDRDRDEPFRDRRYDLVLDAFGKTRLGVARPAIARGGRYVSLVPSAGLVGDLVRAPLMGVRARTVVVRPRGADLALLVRLAATGELRPVIDSTFSLDDVAEAMRRLETRSAHGKVIVTPAAAHSP
jgi:NADPH:quinone reductase-like Zn-dependent oxidoreductase